MKHAVVTSFNLQGYHTYGKRCLESFAERWPEEVDMHVVAEDVEFESPSNNIKIWNQDEINPRLSVFKQEYKDVAKANGYPLGFQGRKNYRWDAVRFSNKVFAITGLYKKIKDQYDQLIWLDADTFTHEYIHINFLYRMAPKNKELVAYLDRREIYPECGWVGYNLGHPQMSDFMDSFEHAYISGRFLDMEENHDSFVFWKLVKEYQSNHGVEWKDLSAGSKGAHHVFINSELGAYLDHMKGNRKIYAESYDSDLIVNRKEKYWQAIVKKNTKKTGSKQ